MGARGTLVLALLVIVGAAYLWVEGPPPESRSQDALLGSAPDGTATQPSKRLLAFAPAEISQVSLTREGKQLIAKRHDDGWVKTTPPGAIADFLEDLSGFTELMHIEAGPDDLHHYGLDPPQAEIELIRPSGPPLLLLLGEHNPPATGAYVRIGRNGPVVLAGALLLWDFDKAFKALGG